MQCLAPITPMRIMIHCLIHANLLYCATHVEYKFDYDCIPKYCGPLVEKCYSEAQPSSLRHVTQSYCKTVGACLAEEARENRNPNACLDGLSDPNLTRPEMEIKACMIEHKCMKSNEIPDDTRDQLMDFAGINDDCMASRCAVQMSSCAKDYSCDDLLDCFDLHHSDLSSCGVHRDPGNYPKTELLKCGWSNKCFSRPGASLVQESDSTVLNPLPNLPTTATLGLIHPVSLIEAHLAKEEAIKRDREAEAAWEASRDRTTSLLAKVHSDQDSMNAGRLSSLLQSDDGDMLVEKLEREYKNQMESLKAENAQLAEKSREDLDHAREEEEKLRAVLTTSSFQSK
jgi:hypothetical protein